LPDIPSAASTPFTFVGATSASTAVPVNTVVTPSAYTSPSSNSTGVAPTGFPPTQSIVPYTGAATTVGTGVMLGLVIAGSVAVMII
jgi:hypothetical protein